MEGVKMSIDQNPFESAIAALEARRIQVNSEIDADIAKLREIGERMTGMVPLSSLAGVGVPAKIEKDTFYNLSFPDAAKKFLGMSNKRPQSTNSIIDALTLGGLKKASYNTMYATLARRSRELGDIINVNGDWGLPEWYGQKPKPKKKQPADRAEDDPLPSAAMEVEDAAKEANPSEG
jgi:hypothetical protein